MIAVTFTITPALASVRTTGPVNAPLVVVTGIFTLTLSPHEAMTRPCAIIVVEIVGEDLEGDRAVGNRRHQLPRERFVIADAGLAHEALDWW